MLDARASLIEDFREEPGLVFGVGSIRNGWTYASLPRSRAIGFGVVAFVSKRGARQDVRTKIEQGRELATVAGLAAGQDERDRQPVEICLEVDFR